MYTWGTPGLVGDVGDQPPVRRDRGVRLVGRGRQVRHRLLLPVERQQPEVRAPGRLVALEEELTTVRRPRVRPGGLHRVEQVLLVAGAVRGLAEERVPLRACGRERHPAAVGRPDRRLGLARAEGEPLAPVLRCGVVQPHVAAEARRAEDHGDAAIVRGEGRLGVPGGGRRGAERLSGAGARFHWSWSSRRVPYGTRPRERRTLRTSTLRSSGCRRRCLRRAETARRTARRAWC